MDDKGQNGGSHGEEGKLTLTEQAYRRAKRDMIECRIAPGTTVSAQQLNEKYKFGLMPIRSALERLTAERWVEALPQRGYRVAPITVRDVVELYDLAEEVSPRLARLSLGKIAGIKDDLLRLNKKSHPSAPPTNAEEVLEIIRASDEIVWRIRDASGNRYASELTQRIFERLDRIVIARMQASAVPVDCRRDFAPLIQALDQNDADGAERASLTNLRHMRALILKEILGLPEIATSVLYKTG